MGHRPLTEPEQDAVLAGLRLLQRELEKGNVDPEDGDIGAILTNDRTHSGCTVDDIEVIIDKLFRE